MSKSLRYKATGSVGRDELNEVFDVLGTFSLSEATTQQIKSVYTSSAVLVSYVLLDGVPVAQHKRGKDVVEDAFGRTFVYVLEPRIYLLISE